MLSGVELEIFYNLEAWQCLSNISKRATLDLAGAKFLLARAAPTGEEIHLLGQLTLF